MGYYQRGRDLIGAHNMDILRRIKGDLRVMEYHGLDKVLVYEAERLKRQIKLLEEMELQLSASAALTREAHNAG